jgi:UDP-N-acetylglucosamine 2-epimerase (non-hydrolysing)
MTIAGPVAIFAGTRPEVIKLAPIIREMQNRKIDHVFITTGQHRSLLDDSLHAMELAPDIRLEVMKNNQNLPNLTSLLIESVSKIFNEIGPSYAVVQGDTTTAFASALSAFYVKCPVGHIEAGLRTNDVYKPFPEEMNRRLITRIATHHFAPTPAAQKILIDSKIEPANIVMSGNSGIDSLFWTRNNILKKSALSGSGHATTNREYIYVTCHRRESFGVPLEEICKALKFIGESNPQIDIIFPVHPNPNVVSVVKAKLSGTKNIFLVEPKGYTENVELLSKAKFVLSDSGGVQEEAPALGKRVLILREETERPEAVLAGYSKLVGTNSQAIIRSCEDLLRSDPLEVREAFIGYGDGNAAIKIVEFIARYLNGNRNA